jgi:hypothetical protein
VIRIVSPLVLAIPISFMLGYFARQPEVRTETKIQEVVRWVKSEATAAATRDAVEKKQSVRVVTRWLRPDGTPSREETREAQAVSTSATATERSAVRLTSGASGVVSERATAVPERPRLHLQGLLGIDAGLQRRWGAAASWRVAGPVTIGAWILPGARIGGASVGITF